MAGWLDRVASFLGVAAQPPSPPKPYKKKKLPPAAVLVTIGVTGNLEVASPLFLYTQIALSLRASGRLEGDTSMAISAPAQSTQYANTVAEPVIQNPARDNAKVRIAIGELTFTAAGFTTAAAGDLKILKMPAGKVRILGALSRVICPAGTATADLDLGIGAYTKADGTTQALVGNNLADSLDAGGALDAVLAPTGGVLEIDSKSCFDVVASFDTANSQASGTLRVLVAYVHGK